MLEENYHFRKIPTIYLKFSSQKYILILNINCYVMALLFQFSCQLYLGQHFHKAIFFFWLQLFNYVINFHNWGQIIIIKFKTAHSIIHYYYLLQLIYKKIIIRSFHFIEWRKKHKFTDLIHSKKKHIPILFEKARTFLIQE